MDRVAAIDVGTNTVLLTVAERRDGKLEAVVERAEITRLGRGVDRTGRLDPASIEATVAVLARFVAEARSLGADRIACVATSACRDAANGEEFFSAARAASGLTPDVISGEEEARLVHRSAWSDFGSPGRSLAVLDVGGGSTELTWGAGPDPSGRRSFQIGAVRLTERISPGDPPSDAEVAALRTAARAALAEVRNIQVEGHLSKAVFVAVAGTVTTLAAVRQALPVYDATRVHGSELSREDLEELLTRLASVRLAERSRLPGMEPKRADVIVAGCAVVLEAMSLGGFSHLTVSDRGVRWGLLHDRFGA